MSGAIGSFVIGLSPIGGSLPTPAPPPLPPSPGVRTARATNYREGASIPGLFPAVQAAVLASTIAASGVSPPSNLGAFSVPMTGGTVQLVPANPNRTYLLIYNPAVLQAQFSLGIATQGALGNLSIGPGEAFFWATVQGLGPVYQGAMTAIGQYPGLPLWVWEDGTDIYNDGGVLAFSGNPASAWPSSPIGLPPGAVWNNGMTIGIVPGLSFTGPPVFFAGSNSTSLLQTTGANYPTTQPTISGQLWSNGGLVCIA